MTFQELLSRQSASDYITTLNALKTTLVATATDGKLNEAECNMMLDLDAIGAAIVSEQEAQTKEA